MECDVSKWQEFRVGDLFYVELSKGDIKIDDFTEGNVRLISSGETDNGVVGHIGANGDGKAEMFSANQMTVDMFGNAFYQDEPFYAVSHGRVNVLKPRFSITKNIALFIATVIKQQQYKYSYGRAVYSKVVENMVIKLPTDPNGEPDWLFMENYIKLLHYKPLTTKNKPGQAPDLNVKNWKKFALIDLFNEVKIAKSADISNLEDGNIPFVGRTDIDNGIQGFVSPVAATKGHCITISMVGTNVALYQENDFQASQNIAVLRKSDITKNMALFICSVINFEMQLKYSYGRTVGKTNIKSMTLNLPADLQGKPDWLFMENYIKSLPYGDILTITN